MGLPIEVVLLLFLIIQKVAAVIITPTRPTRPQVMLRISEVETSRFYLVHSFDADVVFLNL